MIEVTSKDPCSQVICLSGSMKYFTKMMEIAECLSRFNRLVLMPFKDPRITLTDAEKEMYRLQHHQRIDMCDILFVINYNGYIGDSTKEEIDYASKMNKEIQFLQIPEWQKVPITTVCGSKRFKKEMLEWAKDKRICNGASGNQIIFTPQIFEYPKDYNFTEEELKRLDIIHRQKIDMSTFVYIFNKNGYIGEDTRDELMYARLRNKPILYLEKVNNEQEEEIIWKR